MFAFLIVAQKNMGFKTEAWIWWNLFFFKGKLKTKILRFCFPPEFAGVKAGLNKTHKLGLFMAVMNFPWGWNWDSMKDFPIVSHWMFEFGLVNIL